VANYASLGNFVGATTSASEVDVVDFPDVASMAIRVENDSTADALYVTVDGSVPQVPSGPLEGTTQVEVPAASTVAINTEDRFPLQVQVISAGAAPYSVFLVDSPVDGL